MSSESSRPARRQVRQTQPQGNQNEAVSPQSDTAESVIPANGQNVEPEVFAAPVAPLPEPDAPAPVEDPIPSLTEEVPAVQVEPELPPVTAVEAQPEVAFETVDVEEDILVPLVDEPEVATKSGLLGKLPKIGKKASADAETTQKKRSYNPKRKSLIITGSVLGGIALVLGFSLYKIGSAPSTDDIVTVYQEQSGDIGFPIDKGVDTATRFLSLYLNVPDDSSMRQQNTELLNGMLINATAPQAPQGVSQRIISGPTPAGLMSQTSAGTANQRYTALVEVTTREGQQGNDISGNPLDDKLIKTLEQVTYRVNLVVDPTGTAVLVDGNPTLLPNQELTAAMKVIPPLPAPDSTFGNELQTTLITPFFKAWAASDQPAVNALLATGAANSSWTTGLKGTQELGGVIVGAPQGVSSSGAGDVRAEVEWISTDGTRQTSNYTLTVVYENSRWLVSNLN